MQKKFKIISVLVSVTLIICLSAITAVTNSAVVFSGGATKLLPIYSVERSDNKISISFDCAYGVEYTDELLRVLNEYQVKCTFFAVEFWVEKYPSYAKKIVENGHELQTHSSTHPKMSTLNKSQIEKELTSSIAKIESVTGQKVTLFRAPFGDYDNDVISVANSLNLRTIQWDVDSLDWKDTATPDSICKRVTSKVKNGSIVLFHNDADHTPEALPTILKCLKDDGYEFVFIEDLIYKENYEIKHDGTQCEIQN